VLTEQSLADAVIDLQRQDLTPETRGVVDEAARLLNEGREGEARALVEKAEALAHLGENGRGPDGNGSLARNGKSSLALQSVAGSLAAKLAAGFTGVLTGVLEDVHEYAGAQVQDVAHSLQAHIETLEAAVRDAVNARESLEQLVRRQQTALETAQQQQEQLWRAVDDLRQAGEAQHQSLTNVRTSTEELAHHVSNHVDAVAARFASLEERISLLDRVSEEMLPQLAQVLARVDQHTGALRAMEQRQNQRVSALNQVLDSLARLKEPEAPELALAAQA
jgi:ABC-type transporter Mla subunit MlaD